MSFHHKTIHPLELWTHQRPLRGLDLHWHGHGSNFVTLKICRSLPAASSVTQRICGQNTSINKEMLNSLECFLGCTFLAKQKPFGIQAMRLLTQWRMEG